MANIDPKTKDIKQETQNNETFGKDVKHKKVVYKGKRAIYPKKKPEAKQREVTNKQKVSAFSGLQLFFHFY